MGEAFCWGVAGVAHAGQAVERVVGVVALAVASVGDMVEITVGAVGIVAAIERLLVLADGMGSQTALIVVGKVAEQLALLALLFATEGKLVASEPRAVEVDGGERAALGVVVVEFAAVRQAQAFELAAGVVAIAQGAPALMFGDQAVLLVVLEFQRVVVAVVDTNQPAEAVIAVFDLEPVG